MLTKRTTALWAVYGHFLYCITEANCTNDDDGDDDRQGVGSAQPWKGGQTKQLELFERSTSLNRMSH